MEENWETEVSETSSFTSVKPKEGSFRFEEKTFDNIPKRSTGRGRPGLNKKLDFTKPGKIDENNNDENNNSFRFGESNGLIKSKNIDLSEEKFKDYNEEENGLGFSSKQGSNENWDDFGKKEENLESNEPKSFGNLRRNNEFENGETKLNRKFDNDRNFNRRSNENDDGERRGLKFGNKNENDRNDRKEFGFNRRNGENGGFSRRNDEQGQERRFRRNNENGDAENRGFNRGFVNRNDNRNVDEENRGFNRGFGQNNGTETGERRPYRNRDKSTGDGERRNFSKNFGNRDHNNDGERKGFSFNNRNEDNGDGEKRRFNRRYDGEQSNDRRSYNRRNDENGDKENGGFNRGFGQNNGTETGERRPYKNRDKSTGDGERPFRKRDEQNEGFGKVNDKRNSENEPVKKEKYIPVDVEETEESLFTTVAAGVNFKKQIEIKTDLSGNGSEDVKPISSFVEANFSELLLENIQKTKYNIPTAVQQYSIPIILKRRDLMACAQTGSGKTAAFVLPILKNILEDGIESSQLSSIQQPQALILSPTRELALQIFYECKKFSHGSIIQTQTLYGGVYLGYQLNKVENGCNILVATPGRLLHVIEENKISLEKVKYFVLDEADRMLDMGFEKAVRDILEKGKVKEKNDRCTFMFSATFPDEIQRLAQDFLNDYLFLAVGQVGGANTDVEQNIYKVTKFEKRDKCIEILDQIGNERTMIFVEHKKDADVTAFILIQKGYPATSIHGDRLQSQREFALKEFKNGSKNILVCTAVAARGLDIEKVNHVINFDLPSTIDEYVHRIGRTGRCGNLGKSISFFDPESENDQKLARPLVRILSQAGQNIPEWLNSFSENPVVNSESTNLRSTDLRGKFDRMSVESKPSAFSTINAAENEEESWD